MATETLKPSDASAKKISEPFVGERRKVASHINQNEGLIFEKS